MKEIASGRPFKPSGPFSSRSWNPIPFTHRIFTQLLLPVSTSTCPSDRKGSSNGPGWIEYTRSNPIEFTSLIMFTVALTPYSSSISALSSKISATDCSASMRLGGRRRSVRPYISIFSWDDLSLPRPVSSRLTNSSLALSAGRS